MTLNASNRSLASGLVYSVTFYESEGRTFESFRARHFLFKNQIDGSGGVIVAAIFVPFQPFPWHKPYFTAVYEDSAVGSHWLQAIPWRKSGAWFSAWKQSQRTDNVLISD
jgi:hypothetical protein